MKATSLGNLAEVYNEQGDFRQAIRYTNGSLTIDLTNHDTVYTLIDYLNLANYYVKINMPDSALPYATQAYQLALKVNAIEQMPSIQMNLGNIHSALGDDDIALPYFRKSIANALSLGELYYPEQKLLFNGSPV
jgi:tetratricopeptide (TPR) repeat protein